jgi:superfamily II DNA/RNA helicase
MQTSVSRRVLLRIAPAPAVSIKSWTQLRWLHSDPALSSEIDSVPEEEVVENVAIDLDTFLYGDETSFMSTGMTTELADAMQASGKRLPTIIQKKCYGVISSRQNVIVGAETGSGKTLAYLLPIIDQILRKSLERDPADVAPIRSYPNAIIVVPNKELCNQVHRMASEVITHLPKQHEIKIGMVNLNPSLLLYAT